jgi:hypothetical protein
MYTIIDRILLYLLLNVMQHVKVDSCDDAVTPDSSFSMILRSLVYITA